MRNSFKTIGLSLTLAFSWQVKASQICEKALVTHIDIAHVLDLKPLPQSALPAFKKRLDNYVLTQKVTGENLSISVPLLKGIRNTGTAVYRAGIHIGSLGKTQSGRYVILQPISLDDRERQKQLWSSYKLNRLAQKGLAVPVWGRTKVYEDHFWVRPLVYGASPFADINQTGSYATAQQVIDLQDLRIELESIFPNFVHGIILPDGFTSGDPDELAAKVTPLFLDKLREFLSFPGIVANPETGRLLIEELPMEIKGLTSPVPFYLDRWSWYRYILLLKMSDTEQIKLHQHMRLSKQSVEIVLQTEQLSRFLSQSPQFIIEAFENSEKSLNFIFDHIKPFNRPTTVQFKDRSKLKYHFKKHGSDFGVSTPEDYAKEAERFIKASPNDDRHYLLRSNGDILLVDLATDELAVFTSQGLLRTFMKATVDFHKHPLNLYYFFELALREEKFFDEGAI